MIVMSLIIKTNGSTTVLLSLVWEKAPLASLGSVPINHLSANFKNTTLFELCGFMLFYRLVICGKFITADDWTPFLSLCFLEQMVGSSFGEAEKVQMPVTGL